MSTEDPYAAFVAEKLAGVNTILAELTPLVDGPNPPAGAFDALSAAQDARAHWQKLSDSIARAA